MADVNGVLQIEMRRHGRKVVGIVIHVVAVAGLAGAAMAAAVMGDDPIAVIEEEQQLRVPVIGRERPAMREHHRLAAAPVLVVDLDAVFGLDRRHAQLLCGSSIRPFANRTGASERNSRSLPNDDDQAYAGIGRNRRIAPMITTTKNRSTMPWTTANAGPDGGLPGASAVSAGILRKLWITSTNTLK